MLVNCARDWPTLGTKKPNAAAARIRAGKTVTARRAERSSEVRAVDGAAARASSEAGEGVVIPPIVPSYEMDVRDMDAPSLWRAGTGQAWTGSPVSTAAR